MVHRLNEIRLVLRVLIVLALAALFTLVVAIVATPRGGPPAPAPVGVTTMPTPDPARYR